MSTQMRACLVALTIAACSSGAPSATKGRIVVVLTIDWEGAELAADGLDAVEDLRKTLGPVPITHFVSAAYATKDHAPATVNASIAGAIHPGDQLAVHLHAWRSLVRASGVEPKVSPSFLTGTDKMLELGDSDVGFDTDLDSYDVPALRAMLRTSRHLLEQTGIPVSKSFRAGGYLGTPKVLLAIDDEGYAVDSSAVDYHQLRDLDDDALPRRLAQVWPNVDATTQPYVLHGTTQLIELPIAGVVDYVSTAEIVRSFESAQARLQTDPNRDVFVVLAFHLETASDYAGALGDALAVVRGRRTLANQLVFVTVDQAAELARFALEPAPK